MKQSLEKQIKLIFENLGHQVPKDKETTLRQMGIRYNQMLDIQTDIELELNLTSFSIDTNTNMAYSQFVEYVKELIN